MALIMFKFVLGGINDVYYYLHPFSCLENQSIFCLPSDTAQAVFVVGLTAADCQRDCWLFGHTRITRFSHHRTAWVDQQQQRLGLVDFNERINHYEIKIPGIYIRFRSLSYFLNLEVGIWGEKGVRIRTPAKPVNNGIARTQISTISWRITFNTCFYPQINIFLSTHAKAFIIQILRQTFTLRMRDTFSLRRKLQIFSFLYYFLIVIFSHWFRQLSWIIYYFLEEGTDRDKSGTTVWCKTIKMISLR